MAELAKNPPATIDELKSTVEGLAESLDFNDVAKAVANVMSEQKCAKPKMEAHFNTF